jgi:hypothetical protein
MNVKNEGAVFAPVPLTSAPAERSARPLSREAQDPLCELCGHPVIASHCKRICLHCGFMTGCSEGI